MTEQIRIEIVMDKESESMRFIATAIKSGGTIHTIKKYGHDGAGEAYREVAQWLELNGHPVPEYYWLQKYPDSQ